VLVATTARTPLAAHADTSERTCSSERSGPTLTQIGSRVYDGSLKTQLARLRDELARA